MPPNIDAMTICRQQQTDWKEKWEHWTQYCFEQHYAYVNPILIIQVLNGTGGKLTDTDLNECITKIKDEQASSWKMGK